MKILHIVSKDLLRPVSGVSYVLSNLTAEQNKIVGIESRVLAFCKENEVKYDGFESISVKDFSDYIDKYNPDLAVIHSFYYTSYSKASKYLRNRNIPYFLEPHGSFGKNAMKKSWLKKRVANTTIFRSLIKKARGCIYTIEAEERDSYYKFEKYSVIPNGVTISTIEDSAPKIIMEKPVFYYLGRYDVHHKGLDYLFGALKLLDSEDVEIKVNLYGLGSKKQEHFVNKKISSFRHVKAVNCGTIMGSEKKEALENANILLLTSRYEGSPMTILDGFCYGNPCIVTPGTNVADEVEKYGLGWVAQLDEQSIAETILKAIKDYQIHYEEYYNRCRNHVLEKYTWDKIAKYSISEYERMLNNKI